MNKEIVDALAAAIVVKVRYIKTMRAAKRYLPQIRISLPVRIERRYIGGMLLNTTAIDSAGTACTWTPEP